LRRQRIGQTACQAIPGIAIRAIGGQAGAGTFRIGNTKPIVCPVITAVGQVRPQGGKPLIAELVPPSCLKHHLIAIDIAGEGRLDGCAVQPCVVIVSNAQAGDRAAINLVQAFKILIIVAPQNADIPSATATFWWPARNDETAARTICSICSV